MIASIRELSSKRLLLLLSLSKVSLAVFSVFPVYFVVVFSALPQPHSVATTIKLPSPATCFVYSLKFGRSPTTRQIREAITNFFRHWYVF